MLCAIPNPGIIAGPRLLPFIEASMWEVVTVGSQQNRCFISEIEMASSPGGANLCTGGTAAFSVPHGDPAVLQGSPSTAAAAAFDGDATKRAGADRGVGIRYTYTFASPVRIVEIRLKNGGTQEQARVIVVRASTDGGTSWNTMGWFFLSSWPGSATTQTIAVEGTPIPDTRANARAWAAIVNANHAGNTILRMGEIEFAASSGGADIIGGGWPFMDSFWNGGGTTTPDALVDDTTAWTWSWTNNLPRYIGYVFPDVLPDPYEMRLTCWNSGGDASNYPSDLDIAWTANGVDWNVTDSYPSVASWSYGTVRTYTITP